MTRIMVIDDHGAVLDGLVAALTDEPSFEVVTHHTSSSGALAIIDRAAPSVIVVDQGLTGTRGLQTARQLRARWRHFRLVVLVSSPRATLALAALAAGANGIVVKDGNASNLREAVRAVDIDPRLAGQVVSYALRAHGLATPETWTRPAFGATAP